MDELEPMVAGMLVEDEDARYERANELARMGRPALDRAFRLIQDPNPRAREMACYLFANVKDPDQDEWVRLPDGIPTLIRLLEHERNEEVLAAAVYALGHLVTDHPPAGEAASLLCELAAHPSEEIRYAVSHALGSYWEKVWDIYPELQAPVREALLKLASDPDEDVRDWATFGLRSGCHDTPEVRACLWKALEDPNPEVRGEAATGLAEFGDRSFIPRLDRLLREDAVLIPMYFEAAETFADPALLPAVLDGEARWQADLQAGEEMHHYVVSAVASLKRLALESGQA